MKIYLICAVRDQKDSIKQRIDEYVDQLESQGHFVHYPPRDVDQRDDGLGLNILEAHRNAMLQSDEVHVWWDEESKGSHFDLGMAWLLKVYRPEIRIKYVIRPQKTSHKSFNNVFIYLTEKEPILAK
jgi:hypothetical protein